MRRIAAFLCLFAALSFGLASSAEAPACCLSPGSIAVSEDESLLYLGAHTANKVLVFDLEQHAIAHAIPLPDTPTGLAHTGDKGSLIATCGALPGVVVVLNPADGNVQQEISVGHTPTSPVVSPDGRTAYVCERFDDAIARIDLDRGEIVDRIPVDREPVAAALTPDGGVLAVAHLLPSGAADGSYVSATVTLIDTAAATVAGVVRLPNGSASLRGICVSPDGRYAYVTHIFSRYQLPTTQLERGWMNTNALSIIDIADRKRLNTVLLDSVDLGAANPWAVACSADGGQLVVTHAGTHEVSVIDRAALHDRLTRVAGGEAVSPVSKRAEDVPNDLSFLVDIRRRITLKGNGPRALALLGATAYVAEYFSDSLSVVAIDAGGRGHVKSIPLRAPEPVTPARRGEQHFHDASLCFQQWQSCASCHPDARADALNWDLLNDGMGNPKNTKSLLLSHVTPPVMITGIRPDAETAVRAGIRYIQFAVRPEEDAEALDAYLKSLTPVLSPALQDGALSAKAVLGREVFERALCGECHSGPSYTDKLLHDVGTGRGREEDREFDTPSLVEVWRTGPYLYDGRAATLREVLTTFNTDDRHGVTSSLSEDDLTALTAYVMSL